MSKIKELIDLSGRRALITGANGGLGKVMAQTLAEQGCDLILLDHPSTNFVDLTASLDGLASVNIISLSCDLESETERLEAVEKLKGDGVGLDILINNAAFTGASELDGWASPFQEQSLAAWRRALEVNLTAVFHLCQALAPELRASARGSIINIASIYGVLGPDWSLYDDTSMSNPAAYGASKGGLIQFSRWLSTTLAPDVRVNAISPGGVFRQQPEPFVQRYEKRTPLGRMATEDDFRGIVAFLSSDMSQYVTGQNFLVDGGWGIW